MADRVLIVDDDPAVLKVLKKVIERSGIEPETATDGPAALELLAHSSFDLMLLDINLIGMDGFDVIRNLRSKGNQIPIIVVSGRKGDTDTLHGLDLGADDYVTKPFNPVTLGAKVKALIRRSKGGSAGLDSQITAGPFRYHTSTLRLYKNDKEIPLTGKENAIVKLFLDNLNRIFPREMLYEMVWGGDQADDNAIMVYMNRLRQKLEDDPAHPKFIQTVRGIGYRFVV